LKERNWKVYNYKLIQALIKRLATKENDLLRERSPFFFYYRRKRFSAVEFYTKHYGTVPKIFKVRRLPDIKSFYINNGVYVWPSKENKD
jgi:hypothetical protein